MQRSILVVGAGLGGLSAAISLANGGFAVDLIERNPSVSALGAGLTFNGATARAFASLGVLDSVLAKGCAHGTSRVCDRNGAVLAESSTEEVYGKGIPVMGGILRPVLHGIMLEAAKRAGVSIRTGLAVTGWQEHPDAVEAQFSDSRSEVYTLAIGADGLYSATRQQLFPDAAPPAYTGQGCWRAVAPRPASVTTSELYFGTRHKAGINPVSDDLMYLFLLVSAPGNPWHDEADWVDILRRELTDFGGHIGAIRDQLGPGSLINYRPLETIVVDAPWNNGRVLLIGDAAHATTPHVGYGAGLAIEDGIVLADILTRAPTIEAALREFSARRYARCAAVVNGSIRLGQLEIDEAPLADQRALSQQLFTMIREPA